MEVHLVCGNLSDSSSQNEYLLLFLCLQRLINATVPLVLEFSPNAVENLIKMWSIIRNSFQISHLQDECANFLLAFSLPVAIDPLDIVDFVKVTLKSPEKTTPMHLLKVVGCVKALVLMDTNIVVEVSLSHHIFSLSFLISLL